MLWLFQDGSGCVGQRPWRRRRDSNPRYRIYQYDGLANRWFQPLTHVSAWSAALTTVWPRRVAIAMRFAPRNAKACAFFVPLRSFRRPNDSIRRNFDSGHRPFISRAPTLVLINARFAVMARLDLLGSTILMKFNNL